MPVRWTTVARFARIPTLLLGLTVAIAPSARAQAGAPVPNWIPPPSTASAVRGGMHTMGDVTSPVFFIGVAPCRVADTRQPAGPFGGPHVAPGAPRSFAISAGPCTGIPLLTQAYSLNITATNTTGAGFVKVFPQGGASPVVSTLNFTAGQTIANAAVVAAGAGGGITVAASAATDILIDINGYYGTTPDNQQNFLSFFNDSTEFTMTLTNSSATCAGPCGLDSDTFSGTAIEGTSENAFGVYGRTFGNAADNAGVVGIEFFSGTPPPTGSHVAGVRGESNFNNGVLGISQSGGVVGLLINSGGTGLTEGVLGVHLTGASPHDYGVYSFGDFGGTGAKYFVEPHPTDPAKVIRYVSLEGPESGTYFRGTGSVVHGRAVIDVPESFRIVSDTEGLTVQLTPVGAWAALYVVSENLDQIVVESDRDVTFHYMVNGVRKAFRDHQAISEGSEFMPLSASEKMPASLTAEARKRLIANGTYNADGTVNLDTAQREGWTKIWSDREAALAAQRDSRDPLHPFPIH